MASVNDDESNPYRPPATRQVGADVPIPAEIDAEMLKKFREQVLALGVLWIIIGTAVALLAGLALAGNQMFAGALGGDIQVLLVVVATMGLAWIVLGVLTCLKQIRAVYVGLVLSYLSLIGNLLNLNLCGIVVVIVVILQAHRVIGWAHRLQAAGVPLTARPR